MKYIQLCKSQQFENICNNQCSQHGSFALITTEYPWQTEDRLNNGWQYWNGPRNGTRSPPLAYCTDWKIEKTWIIGFSNGLTTQTAAFWALFERPCMLYELEKRLMHDDNALFLSLKAKGISKNGLECVACLKKQTYPTLSDTECGSEDNYKLGLSKLIIDRLNTLFSILALNASELRNEPELDTTEEEK